jgi:uncharacterized protein
MTRPLFAVLLPTLGCDLSCTYCFEPRRAGAWSLEETERVLDRVAALARTRGAPRLELYWQGGEVLTLGATYWEGAGAAAVAAGERHGVEVVQRLQTNLVGWDGRLAPLVHRRFGGVLGTSYEGTGERRMPGTGGAAAFEAAWWAALARARADGLRVGVLALVTPALLRGGPGPLLERLAAGGVAVARFALPFSVAAGRGLWVDAEAAGAFLVEAYRWWRRAGREAVLAVRPFAFLEAALAGRAAEGGLCTFSGCCAEEGLAVAPDGEVTLCDSFVGVGPAHANVLAGPILDLFERPARAEARRACAALVDEACARCRFLAVCQGGCLARSRPAPYGERRDAYCEAYRALFSEVEAAQAAPAAPRPGDSPRC